MKLKTRRMKCVLQLNKTSFGDKGNVITINDDNTVSDTNPPLTIVANINETLTQQFDNSADIQIYGLDINTMNTISTIGQILNSVNVTDLNTVMLYAGYDDNYSLVYQGQVLRAYPIYTSADRILHLQCNTNYMMQLNNISSYSSKGSTDVAGIYSDLAQQLSLAFVNNGVTVKIDNPVLVGSPIDKLKSLTLMTGLSAVIKNGTLFIGNKGSGLFNQILSYSADNEMIGYPIIDEWGIMIRAYFNPQLNVGQFVKVSSYIPKANGQFYCYSVNSSISNNQPNWYSDIRLSISNSAIGVSE